MHMLVFEIETLEYLSVICIKEPSIAIQLPTYIDVPTCVRSEKNNIVESPFTTTRNKSSVFVKQTCEVYVIIIIIVIIINWDRQRSNDVRSSVFSTSDTFTLKLNCNTIEILLVYIT